MKAEQEQPRPYGTGYKLIGKDYSTNDLVAKVTGKSKYAEDFRAEGMLFCRLVLSPMPHARVKSIRAEKALAMPGVKAILTPAEVPGHAAYMNDNGTMIKADKWGELALADEPMYQGEPILAVAAVDELTCAEAIEKIEIEMEPLPFATDPLESLRPGSSNAREDGNVWVRPAGGRGPDQLTELKWTDEDFAAEKEGRLPMGHAPEEWSYGDVDAGFKNAALVLDETFMTPDVSHQCLEPRTTMAYWQNGKLFLYTGTQSTFQTVAAIARWMHMDEDKIVFISEYTGGGFGSKITGALTLVIPALLSRKLNAPVMMRVSREEEHFIGRARPGIRCTHEGGFCEGWPHHGGRHVPGERRRILWLERRRRLVRKHRFIAIPGAGDALPECDGGDEHATAQRTERAGRHAGDRDHGAHSGQGGAATGSGPGCAAAHQLSGGQGGIRTSEQRGQARVHHKLLPEAGAGPRREAVQME